MALEERTSRDYRGMIALLRNTAGAGKREAQEMLGSVLLVGASLYGSAVKADPCEAAHWSGLAATQGSTIGRHQFLVLNGMRELPEGDAACAAPKG